MNYQSIAEVYTANEKIREKTRNLLENLSVEDAELRADAESWTIREIVEHLSTVENGMMKISAKLLSKSERKENNGQTKISPDFVENVKGMQTRKFNAPEQVLPVGNQSISESLTKMSENRRVLEEMRPMFEAAEIGDVTFPHPFLGNLNAHEWLALIGGHEARHLAQIKGILDKHKQS